MATPLSSPWALAIHNKDLLIAMAGYHQIWKLPLDGSEIGPFAGNGKEDIVDGPRLTGEPYEDGSSFAQPSGLSSNGTWLYVADSEGSSIRAVPLEGNNDVRTVVGSILLRQDRLFAFGIDPTGGGLPHEPASDWPTRDEVATYNAGVRAAIDHCLAEADLGRAELGQGRVFEVAIEHRLMHVETLAYLLHQLPFDRKRGRATDPPPAPVPSLRERTARIPAGRATLGQSRTSGTFGWDNEYDEWTTDVPAFTIDAGKVSNREYLEFVRAGGYAERPLWSDDDWAWREQQSVHHPLFWLPRDGGFSWRGMFAELPLPLDAPVYVSHAEASAYARWKHRALPSEGQFHRAAFGTPEGGERAYPWGDEAPQPHHGNFDFQRWEPTPAGAFPAGNSAFGVADLIGNGWEWTSTVFAPFAGFERFPFYAGYSADFFDGKHYVMKGGSPRTAACMLRRSFRNWFQPHYPYVYATFRCVEH
jgi:ergothioneine biosynthesis protein EgtB